MDVLVLRYLLLLRYACSPAAFGIGCRMLGQIGLAEKLGIANAANVQDGGVGVQLAAGASVVG